MTEALQFGDFISTKYKLKLEKDDLEFLYQQYQNSKEETNSNINESVRSATNANATCPFKVVSKNDLCGVKLKNDQEYCTRHQKVLTNRQQKQQKPTAATRKKDADNSWKALYFIDKDGVVTHRKDSEGNLTPLNQEDIDLCKSKHISFREPQLDDFLENQNDDEIATLGKNLQHVSLSLKL